MSDIIRRKSEHLKLAKKSQHRFELNDLSSYGLSYEPCLAAFPTKDFQLSQKIAQKTLNHPLWISSMTGGSSESGKINIKLAKAVAHFGLGMGLGSCRVIMDKPRTIKDFKLRPILKNCAFWANIGICQLDEYLNTNQWQVFGKILEELEVDGLIVHINPTQEFLQNNGSKLKRSAMEILKDFYSSGLMGKLPVMVKEVGQGMGPKSLKALSQFPLKGIEFAALGGTNFATLEILRNKKKSQELNSLNYLTNLGHSAKEMVDFWLKLRLDTAQKLNQWHLIISGARGHDILSDVALFKKVHRFNNCSLGLGFKILEPAYKGDKFLISWIEEYLKNFYYVNSFTELRS